MTLVDELDNLSETAPQIGAWAMRGKVDWELIERIAGELGVSSHACAKWRQRNSIPHKWRLSIVLKSGGLIRWDDFVRLDRQRRGTMQ